MGRRRTSSAHATDSPKSKSKTVRDCVPVRSDADFSENASSKENVSRKRKYLNARRSPFQDVTNTLNGHETACNSGTSQCNLQSYNPRPLNENVQCTRNQDTSVHIDCRGQNSSAETNVCISQLSENRGKRVVAELQDHLTASCDEYPGSLNLTVPQDDLEAFHRDKDAYEDAIGLEKYLNKYLTAQQARRDTKHILADRRQGHSSFQDAMYTDNDPYREWRSKLARRKHVIKFRERRDRSFLRPLPETSSQSPVSELTQASIGRVVDDIRESCLNDSRTPKNLVSSERFSQSSHSDLIIKSLARDIFGVSSTSDDLEITGWEGYEDLGDPVYSCQRCNAELWYGERDRMDRTPQHPTFSMCCKDGKVELPYLTEPPKLIKDLLHGVHPKSRHFKDNIRMYNSAHSFTSSGGKIDHSVNEGRGPYTYRIGGQNAHLIGSLLPNDDQTPKFCQLYIYDTEDEVNNRKRAFRGQSGRADRFDDALMHDIRSMIDEYNPLAKSFRMARDTILTRQDTVQVRLKLIGGRHTDGRTYNLPSVSEVAALIVGDIDEAIESRDIVIVEKSGRLQRISELHPSYLALQYPLFFPRGEDGYRLGIKHCQLSIDVCLNPETAHVKTTLREWFAFRLQDRPSHVEPDTLLRGGRLFQQLIVDGYTMIESQRITYLKFNQPKLRSANYKHLSNAVDNGETDTSSQGVKYILPSSFVGGKGYMRETYQDTMTICRWCGYPDLFITFTCNPKWPEITRFVQKRGLQPEDRPDIVSRVFRQKLELLMKDLKDNHVFGRTRAVVYTIEFQKRGLPHAHILLFLERDDKFPEAVDVDSVISAEIPDPLVDPSLHEAVKDLMIHGPCGLANPKSPCMTNGVCTKRFPKAFCERTTVDGDGYPMYQRRDNGIRVEKGGVSVHNGFVVPYNAQLLTRYHAHINVEWCNQARSIKYLFKYVNKGYDRVTVGASFRTNPDEVDHIQEYYDCRYVSPCEAAWRIFSFEIHYRTPPVLRLEYHLPNEQNVVYNDDDPLDEIVARSNGARTKFTAWLEYNADHCESRELTYSEFPTKYVWQKEGRCWTPRKRGFSLGRMYHMSPNGGERYYMRLLLNFVRGPTCYADIRTVKGVVYDTYKDACYALGLLGDDKEYVDAIEEASYWGSGVYLRNMFATLLFSGSLVKPEEVWEKTWHHLCDDILSRRRKELLNFDLQMTDEQLKNYALSEIEAILLRNGSSLSKFPNMPCPDQEMFRVDANRLISDELSYDRAALNSEYLSYMSTITDEQRAVYDSIIDAVESGTGGLFFLYGHGGTGKTFIWKTLCADLRSKGQIVLPVASSGIAATLLPRGRTAHSRFSIPINVDEKSMCPGIKPGSDLAELLIKAKLIIWDEAPMVSRYCFEALDRSLRDITRFVNPSNADKPFGGKVVVLGRDFRQILPVVPKGSRQDIVYASICSSPIWRDVKVLRLNTNMRLQCGRSIDEVDEIREFSEWILNVGDGLEGGPNDGIATIKIPDELLIHPGADSVAAIVGSTYPDFENKYKDTDYLQERAVLAPTHDVVEKVNAYVLSTLPGDEVVYLSSDEISSGETCRAILDLYSTEYLNTIRSSGLPNHRLCLKVGAIVMLLRNLDQANGLCNGTRLIISKLGDRVLEAKVISGIRKGEMVYIPRIKLSPSDETKFPIQFERRQFPIAVCFAMTINKSQGQSLSNVGLFLQRPVFTHGQLYVALSRVTTKRGLKVLILDEDDFDTDSTTNVVYKEIFSNTR